MKWETILWLEQQMGGPEKLVKSSLFEQRVQELCDYVRQLTNSHLTCAECGALNITGPFMCEECANADVDRIDLDR